jgi:ABC-type transport system involved in cytochrome c biogenesis permease subunit
MATITKETGSLADDQGAIWSAGRTAFVCLGSLKLTVALFALSLVTVLVGTLAQDEMNMLEVKQRYFMSWIAPLHIDDFFPQAFVPHDQPYWGVIPFPGGALIGLMLMINLFAAKTTRFKTHANGGKLIAGLLLIAAGVGVAAAVIMAGHSNDGLQGTPPISYQRLWAACMAGLTLLGIGLGVAGTRVENSTIKSIAFTSAAIIAIFITYALFTGFRIGDPGLRIVWQLTKGLGAGVILLCGCLLVFDRQGGNVLLHLGVGLLMVGQFAFGDRQLEQRLNLVEGESANTLVNMDAVEMTFIENSDGNQTVTAIPGSRLRGAAESNQVIKDAELPVDVRVLEFYDNSTFKDVTSDNIATTGDGLEIRAVKLSKWGGTDSRVNVASAYVELLDKSSGESLGTHLISQLISDRHMLIREREVSDMFDTITVADKSYDIGLKFHREVKPYWVQLEDVRRINYSGTETPRDYSSFIRIVDTETGEDRKERVWMNNPLRYRGETFFQSDYTALPSGKEMTGIQVVRNSGWLIPYVACSITALGMLAHFLGVLRRFVRRRERETSKQRAELAEFNLSPPSRRPVVAAVAGFVALALVMLTPWQAVMNKMRPESRAARYDFYTAGKIPTQFGGRIMPLDAYARQTLKAISNKESLPLEDAPAALQRRANGKPSSENDSSENDRARLSAMQWLMEIAVDAREVRFLPMFRIDADEVRSELGLDRRETKLYSLDEIGERWDRVSKIAEAANEKETRDLSFKERKLLELDRRTRHFTVTAAAFRLPIPQEIPAEVFEQVFPEADEEMRKSFAIRELGRRMEALKQMQAPAIIPPEISPDQEFVNQPNGSAFGPAFFDYASSAVVSESSDEERPGIKTFGEMITAYDEQDTAAFNDAVDRHLKAVQEDEIPGYSADLVSLERWMQSNWPTGVAMFLYLVSMVMGLVYIAVNLPRLRQVVCGTLCVAFAVHTLAIICRITITGRAPVINIYSSAVFIGWAAVLFGLVLERIFRYGTGNMLSAAAGVMTLLVAYGLNTGDTMPVLQAVLDTQFWLATHVISVTLGYVATLVGGVLGMGYLMSGWLGKGDQTMRDLYRCCYGACCFGILFSFVGTVLGGLWADDSWGRFWGWDPKENGALLIVIWNALMLHARWDGMVGARGFASLAIGGNIVTAWSWFGTNELGIGFHSYGFTSGVLMYLSLFIGSQIAFIAADSLFRMLRLRFGTTAT